MSIVLNGTTGITTPDVTSDGSLKIDASAPDDSLVVDALGNAGLGVTPSATTGSGVKGFEIGGVGNGLLGNSANVWATQNVYFGAGFKKAGAGYATMYNQSGGTHNWNVSTTSGGVAGDAISFTQAMTLDQSGNLLVGTTSASQSSGNGVKLNPSGAVYAVAPTGPDGFSFYNTTASAYRFYVNSSGTVNATSTTISAISDIRFKENVRDLDAGLAEVMALKPRLYDWKEGKGADIKNARGFIAQEFEEVFPDLIDEWRDPAPEGEEPYKSVRQDLMPVLVKAIQEQQAIIESLTARVSALEAANV